MFITARKAATCMNPSWYRWLAHLTLTQETGVRVPVTEYFNFLGKQLSAWLPIPSSSGGLSQRGRCVAVSDGLGHPIVHTVSFTADESPVVKPDSKQCLVHDVHIVAECRFS